MTATDEAVLISCYVYCYFWEGLLRTEVFQSGGKGPVEASTLFECYMQATLLSSRQVSKARTHSLGKGPAFDFMLLFTGICAHVCGLPDMRVGKNIYSAKKSFLLLFRLTGCFQH